MRAVAQHRHAFLGDGGEHQFARRAVGQGLFGDGVDDLGDDVVLADVHAVLGHALKAHAGAGDLGKAVDVVGVDAEQFLDLLAHLLCPGFGAKAAGLELEVGHGDARLADGLAQIQGVGGRAAEHGGAQFLDHHDLALGVAAGHGDDRGPQPARALMRAEAAGEEAVAVGDLDDVVRAAARGGDAARHQFGPDIHIVLRIAGNDGMAGGAAGALYAHDVVQGRGEQAVGELVAQVGLLHEGQVFEVVHIADVLGADALGVHARAVDGDVVVFVFHRPAQALGLEGVKLIAADGFHFRVKHIVLSGCGQAQHPLR